MLKLKSVNFNHQLFQEYILDPAEAPEWVIGRDPRCHLVLTTLDVSRTHGRIFYEDAVYYFENISQHGTSFNSDELLPHEKKPLNKGDLLVLGETYLQIESLSAPSEQVFEASPRDLPQSAWEENLQVRCCRIIEETVDVKTFWFVADSSTLFHYKPGQFVNLELEIEGKSVVRPYSISSSPSRPHAIAITIKRLPQLRNDLPPGLVSNWMHDHFRVGDRLRLGKPLGNFTCVPDVPPKILLASAGSGITPMMSMARWLQDTLTPCDVIFLHSARTPDDLIFRQELAAMAAQMPNFRLVFTVSRPSAQTQWTGLTGRISEMMLQLVVPDLNDRAVYVCGSSEWMQNIKSILTKLDFPMAAYREESFGGYRPVKTAKPEQNGKTHSPVSESSTVQFTESNLTVESDGELSILELAEQEGVAIPNACRAGACGACKLHAQGQVRYVTPPTGLSAADREAGYALACVAHPVGSLDVKV